MGTISAAKAREHFSEIMNEVAYGKRRILLTRRGKELVAVVPIEDVKLLEAIEEKIDLDAARRALQDAQKHGTISWDVIKKEMRR